MMCVMWSNFFYQTNHTEGLHLETLCSKKLSRILLALLYKENSSMILATYFTD